MEGLSLTSCRAIVTGASSGLGADFARQLAGRAQAVMLVARRREALEAVAAELRSLNAELEVEVRCADLNDAAAVGEIEAGARTFRPNLLINNAGLGDYGSFESATREKLRAQMVVNVEALVLLTHAVLPHLSRPGGVLNVGSLAGTLPMPDLAVYAASKAFVDRFSEALAVELAGQGVTVSCICPGPTPTQFGAQARREQGEDTNRSGQELLRIPPEQVVAEALAALERGRPVHFAGRMVRVAAGFFQMLPRSILRMLIRRRMAASGAAAAEREVRR